MCSTKTVENSLRLHDQCENKSFLRGLFHVLCPLLVWALSLTGILFVPWWAKIVLGFINGHSIGVMLIIGHDALHGALFPKRWMNYLAGRVSMATSFHPVTSWVHSHNGLHHGFTNLKGKDAGFAPLSLIEYRALSRPAKLSYTVSRSWYGCGWLYFKYMWFDWEFFPNALRAPHNSKTFLRDRLQLAAFAAAWIGLLLWAAIFQGVNSLYMVAYGFILPQFISNYLTGFITLQQHTHPQVAWYSEADSPPRSFFQTQLNAAPHLVFPTFMRSLMRNVMEHTAHHAEPAAPFYSLPSAQNKLEYSCDYAIFHENWSPRTFFRTTRTCKLYDYNTHQWIDYNGNYLTETICRVRRCDI